MGDQEDDWMSVAGDGDAGAGTNGGDPAGEERARKRQKLAQQAQVMHDDMLVLAWVAEHGVASLGEPDIAENGARFCRCCRRWLKDATCWQDHRRGHGHRRNLRRFGNTAPEVIAAEIRAIAAEAEAGLVAARQARWEQIGLPGPDWLMRPGRG